VSRTIEEKLRKHLVTCLQACILSSHVFPSLLPHPSLKATLVCHDIIYSVPFKKHDFVALHLSKLLSVRFYLV